MNAGIDIFNTCHPNVSLVGGSSIHKWFEIAVSYRSGRLVWKELLFVGCVVMQTRQRLNNVAHALMISLAEEKSYSLPFFPFFFFLSWAGGLAGVFPLYSDEEEKIERDSEHGGITAQTVCHGQESNLCLHAGIHM